MSHSALPAGREFVSDYPTTISDNDYSNGQRAADALSRLRSTSVEWTQRSATKRNRLPALWLGARSQRARPNRI